MEYTCLVFHTDTDKTHLARKHTTKHMLGMVGGCKRKVLTSAHLEVSSGEVG